MVLLELLGGPKFATEVRAAAASTGMLGKNVEKSGKQMQVMGRRAFIANQALYTLRRYAFYGTTAVIGLTAVVAKLGYGYISAMQQARVALRPFIKDHAVLEGYLNRLFQISKFSPFVLKDLTIGFRQLFAGLHPIGVGSGTILTTIQSLTDFMSMTGKTGPGAFQRVALAIQHMSFAGRLTGYAVNQLSRDGIPIFAILNKEMGITGDQLHNISKMGIPASKVLAAINKYARDPSNHVAGAAMRLSLQTLPGLLQVARDSLSQLSASFVGSAYKGGQGFLYGLLKKGGPLDQLSNVGTKHGGGAAVTLLSKQVTGHTGLGQGFMLLVSTAMNLGRVFATVLVPAFILGLHSLILLYPFIKLINLGLGFMAHNASWLKYVFAVLAAEFVFTHGRLLLLWGAMKFFRLATFGAIGPLFSFVKVLKALIVAEKSFAITSVVANWSQWAFALKAGGKAEAVWGVNAYKNMGLMAKMSRFVLTLRTSMAELAAATWAAVTPFAALALALVATVAAVYGIRKLDKALNPQGNMTHFSGGKWNPVTWLAYPGELLLGRHGSPSGNKSKIAPVSSAAGSSTTNPGAAGGGTHTTVHQLVVDRKVLAEAVDRHRADVQGRR